MLGRVCGLGDTGGVGFRRRDVDDLVNRLHASAIPVASNANAPSLIDAVASCGLGSRGWPIVLAAFLAGRINLFRRSGACTGPAVGAFLASSIDVVRDAVVVQTPRGGVRRD